MHWTRHAIRWTALMFLVASCVGCDQVTKQLAITRLKGQPPCSYCGNLMRLEYAENPGAFLGLGRGLSPSARWLVLVVGNGLLAAGIGCVLLLNRRINWIGFMACTLLLAGALGNLIDRVRFDGLVIDFMNLGVGPLRTGIFNVADVAITTGAVVLMAASFGANVPSPASEPGPTGGQ